jgi:hypothetical protein
MTELEFNTLRKRPGAFCKAVKRLRERLNSNDGAEQVEAARQILVLAVHWAKAQSAAQPNASRS